MENLIASAEEIERIFEHLPMDKVSYDLLKRLYGKIYLRLRSSHYLGLAAVFLMGQIYGIRSERKRRKDGKKMRNISTESMNELYMRALYKTVDKFKKNGYYIKNALENAQEIIKECKACEIEDIFGHMPINNVDYDLLEKVYNRIDGKFFGLAGIY
jgi:hypothetical protein